MLKKAVCDGVRRRGRIIVEIKLELAVRQVTFNI